MADTHVDTPEFHIVVRRPGRGPLAPYRLSIAILFAFAVAGTRLWAAANGSTAVDGALLLAAIAGTFAWLVVGRANAILKAAAPPKRPPTE